MSEVPLYHVHRQHALSRQTPEGMSEIKRRNVSGERSDWVREAGEEGVGGFSFRAYELDTSVRNRGCLVHRQHALCGYLGATGYEGELRWSGELRCSGDVTALNGLHVTGLNQTFSRQTPDGCPLVGFCGLEALEPEQGLVLISSANTYDL